MAETYAPQIKSNFSNYLWVVGSRIDHFFRRLMDILVSASGLILFSPAIIFLGILIKRDSRGPVFYRGRRIGKDGKLFNILKFRTMYDTQEALSGPRITCDGDARITSFGQWLRDTKLNELPQLWNVLVGQMSLVGPRPEDPEIAMNWPESVRDELLSVRPGITSPASIVYRDEEKLLSGNNLLRDYFHDILPSKLRLDRVYLKNRNLLSDLDVIFLTAVALLPIIRKQAFPEYLLYWGPIARLTSRFGMWLILDSIVALGATWVAGIYWRTFGPMNVGLIESLTISIAIALLFSLTNLLIGLSNISWANASASDGVWVVFSGGVGTMLLMALDRFIFGHHLFPTGMMMLAGAISTIGFGMVRFRERLITSVASRWLVSRKKINAVGERVLIVGAGEMGGWAVRLFTHGDFAAAFSIAGIVDDNPRKIGMVFSGITIKGTSKNIPQLVRKLDIGVVVFAINQIEVQERARILNLCKGLDVKLVILPDFMATLRTSMKPEEGVILEGVEYRHVDDGLNRVQKNEVNSWMKEMEALLSAHDVDGAQALLLNIRSKIDNPF
jgi:lipopolysaccharide/colanic/teichoic acid biosynthesis glycosyltransferase